MIRFDEQVAIVTGAGRGLGRAYAMGLAARGARVVVNDLGVDVRGHGDAEPVADSVVREIAGAGGIASANRDDVGDPAGAKRLVAQALDLYGRVDVVINNAGILPFTGFHKMPTDEFEAVVRVHLLGTAFVTREAYVHMRRQDYGRILLTTSNGGLFGSIGCTHYAAAKLGVVGFMNCLKLEASGRQVLVNAIAPIAATRMTGQFVFKPEEFARFAPEHIAPLALYLVSSQCAVTGHVIEVAPGYCARVEIVEAPGVRYSAEQPPEPEMFAARYAEIADTAGARTYADTIALMQHVFAGTGVTLPPVQNPRG